MDKLDRRIESLGGGRTRGGRAKNAKSLVALLVETLGKSSKPLQVGDIVEKWKLPVTKQQHNFRGIVNQTLIKEKQFVSAGGSISTKK